MLRENSKVLSVLVATFVAATWANVALAVGPVSKAEALSIPANFTDGVDTGEPDTTGTGNSVSISGDNIIVGTNSGFLTYARSIRGDFGLNTAIMNSNPKAVVVQNGRYLVGDAKCVNANNVRTGCVSVYDDLGLPSQLYASDGRAGDQFGASVALDGNTIIVGDPYPDPARGGGGEVYIFELQGGEWIETTRFLADSMPGFSARDELGGGFGNSLALSGSNALIDAPYITLSNQSGAGQVYGISRLASGSWQQTTTLKPSSPQLQGFFGGAMALDGARTVVSDNPSGIEFHSFSFFDLTNGIWQPVPFAVSTRDSFGDYDAYSLSLQGDRALIGVVGGLTDTPGGGGTPLLGYARLLERKGTEWQETALIEPSEFSGFTPSEYFGASVSLNKNEVVIGDPGASFILDGVTHTTGAAFWLAFDDCPDDPNKLTPGLCGCGVPETANCTVQELGTDILKAVPGLAALCPSATGINYLAGGSILGEKALITSATQSVSPMSRFLESAACGAPDPSKAEGIAFAADGLSIVASSVHRAACDPSSSASPTASCGGVTPSGLRNSGTIGSYTLGDNSAVTHVQGWQDVLRQIFLGLSHDAGKDPNVSTASTIRDCNNAVRQALVNNWGNLFENSCAGTGGNCTQLNHIFRPDLSSGAADVLRELINAKSFPFCNQRFAGDSTPVDYPTTLSNGAPIFEEEYQDFDPIRRSCLGGQTNGGAFLGTPIDNADGSQTQPDFAAAPADQVCSPKGTLGLVLPIRPAFFNGQDQADAYPTKPCLRGALAFGHAPKIPGTAKSTLCPNGDVTLGNTSADYDPTTGQIAGSSDTCLVPVAADGDFRCINGKNNFNAPIDPPLGLIPASQRDGRVYNLHLYTQTGSYRIDTREGSARDVVGDFSRLHTTRTSIASNPTCTGGICCNALDTAGQTGCLTEADPCSLGLAAGVARNAQLPAVGATQTAFATSINDVQNTQACVTSDAYPLTRRLYLNTTIGFENVQGPELALIKCLSDPSTSLGDRLASFGLYPLAGGPVCQDFAQEACPGGGTASDACANNPLGIPSANRCASANVNDLNPCTNDSCDPSCSLTACTSSGVTHTASDGLACTVDDPCKNSGTCSGGICNATAITLTNTDPCIAETCSPEVGVVRTPLSGATSGGTCNAGVFIPTGTTPVSLPATDSTAPSSSSGIFAAIYDPANGLQTGASVGTSAGQLNPDHAAHVFGTVRTSSGAGLGGVSVTILGHTEAGAATTRADGSYDIVFNGGGTVVVRLTATGYLPVDRRANPIWGGGAHIDDVVMLTVDPAATTIPLNSSSMLDATGSTTTTSADPRGQRQVRLGFPPGTTATWVSPSNVSTSLSEMTVHATEFTVGDSAAGAARMPAPLPGSSLYTYAVDFSVDEVPVGSSLVFNQPVFAYLDNFVNIPTGAAVPNGYYDRTKAAWVAEDNGLVMAIVGYDGGQALIDLTGDGVQNSSDDTIWSALPANEQVTPAERTLLATRYPGATQLSPKSLWRVPVSHFSIRDFNWGGGVACVDGKCPDFSSSISGGDDAPREDACQWEGSIIDAEQQSLGESIPVVGTPYSLEYRSSYNLGYLSTHGAEVDFNPGPNVLTPVRYEVSLSTPGGFFKSINPALATNYLSWNGLDGFGRRVNGSQLATFTATSVYRANYAATGHFGDAADNDSVTAGYATALSEPEVYFTRSFTKVLSAWGADTLGLGGWTISPMHVYDPTSGILYQGDGTRRDMHAEPVINLIAGNGSTTNAAAGVTATNTGIQLNTSGNSPGLVVASNGDIYFWSLSNSDLTSTLRKIDPLTRIVSDVVNFGSDPVTRQALIVTHMALSPDEQYIYVGATWRVLRVNLSGTPVVQFFAGGQRALPVTDGPATQATFFDVEGITASQDGTIYVSDTGVIRKIATDDAHTVTTVAGKVPTYSCESTSGVTANGQPANQVSLASSMGTVSPVVAPDGSMYISTGRSIIHVNQSGTVTCMPASGVTVGGIAIAGADQSVYFGASDNTGGDPTPYTIRKLLPDGTSTIVAGGLGCGEPTPSGARAAGAKVCNVLAMTPGPDGSIYFINHPAGGDVARIYQLALPVTNLSADCQLALPSEDGKETFCFDSTGRHLSTRNTATGQPLLTFNYTDGLLSSIHNEIDLSNTTISPGNGSSPVTISGPFGQTTKIGLDPTTKYATYIEDPAQQRTLVSHAGNGLLLSMTDRNGQLHSFSYDELGRLKRDFDPAGGYQILTRQNDANGGYVVSDQSAMGAVNSSSVDLSTTGVETRKSSDADGAQNTSDLQPSGDSVTHFADGSTLTESTVPDAQWPAYQRYVSSSTLTLPSGLSRTLTRNKVIAGGVIAETSMNSAITTSPTRLELNTSTQTYKLTTPLGRVSTVTVDGFGRPVTATLPGVDPITYNYDAGRLFSVSQGSRLTTLNYYSVGGPHSGFLSGITVKNPDSPVTVTSIPDDVGRPLSETAGQSPSLETDFTWDAEGNLRTLTLPSRDPGVTGPVHTQTYTPVDLLQSYLPPSVSDADASSGTILTYDPDRQLELLQTPSGYLRYTYDATTHQLLNDSEGDSFTYYPSSQCTGCSVGRLLTANASVPLSFSYNGSLLSNQTWTGLGSVDYAYDAAFRESLETITAGSHVSAIAFGYDNDDLITCASLTSCANGAANKLTINRDPATGAVSDTAIGVVTDAYTRNEYGELASYTVKVNGSAVFSLVYDDGTTGHARDGLGRVTYVNDNGATRFFKYDGPGRLVNVSDGVNNLVSYTYDSAGNRLSVSPTSTTPIATYDYQDRLLTYAGASYSYAPDGSLAHRVGADGSVVDYSFNALGRMTSATINGVAYKYLYDGLGRRVGKDGNGNSLRYLYRDSLSPVAVTVGSSSARFVYGTRLNTPELMQTDTGVYRYVCDQLGSPRLLVNVKTGAIAETISYDEFGNETSPTTDGEFDPQLQPFGFAGGLYDGDTKLVHFGSRDYEAQTGRWLAKDPDLFQGGQANLYVYVANDPINFRDEQGKNAAAVTAGFGFGEGVAGGGWLAALGEAGPLAAAFSAGYAVGTVIAPYVIDPLVNAIPTEWFSKGGKQNVRDTEFQGLPWEEIQRRYKDATGLEKKRLEKELKGRGKKNKRKRGHGIFFGNADDDEFCGTSTE